MRDLGGALYFAVFERFFFFSCFLLAWLKIGLQAWGRVSGIIQLAHGKGLGSIPKDSHVIPFGVCCGFLAMGSRVAPKGKYTPLTEDILQHPKSPYPSLKT